MRNVERITQWRTSALAIAVVCLLAACATDSPAPADSPSPSPLNTATSSPSTSPTAERELSATGEVPFAGGEWALYIPASWGASANEQLVLSALPDEVEVVGVWQVTDDPNDLVFVGALPATGASDETFETTARTSSSGIKMIAADSSTSAPEWTTTVGGYRQVTVVTNAVLEDDSTATQVGSVVVLGDTAIYIVSTSLAISGATGAVETVANSIE